jgi:hypothetical protein
MNLQGKMAFLVVIGALMLASAFPPTCAFSVNLSRGKQYQQRKNFETDILEVVLRYQFAHQATQQVPYTKVIFVSVEKKDPSEILLKRFSRERLPIKKVSRAMYMKDSGAVRDRRTKAEGLIYNVGPVKWLSETEVEVEASYYGAMLFADGCRYRVSREGEKWVVQDCAGPYRES